MARKLSRHEVGLCTRFAKTVAISLHPGPSAQPLSHYGMARAEIKQGLSSILPFPHRVLGQHYLDQYLLPLQPGAERAARNRDLFEGKMDGFA
jgi:hypothetical protein